MVPIVDTLTGVAMAIVVVVGGQMVLGERLDVGVMVAFLFYVQRFFDPIRSLTMQYSDDAARHGRRASGIFEVLDVPVDIADKPGRRRRSASIDGSVEFRNVTFGYVPGHAGPARRQLPGEPGRDGRAGRARPARARPAPWRSSTASTTSGRAGAGRRPRRARRHPGLARAPDRHGAAGAVPVHRHGAREHPLHQGRRDPRRR